MTAPIASTWRNRIVGSADVAPGELVPNDANWRRHPDAQRAALRGSLDQVGWVQQVLVNTRTGRMIDGHARLEEAIEHGAATVPVLYVDLDEAEERLVLATLDPIGSMATTDDDALRSLLAGIDFVNEALEASATAFLEDLRKVGLTDPDDVPDVPAEPYVNPGELWLLGEHRLLCGSAIEPAEVARLLGDAQPRLLVTDPPYGVQLDPTWRDGLYNAMGPSAKPYMQKPGHHFPVGQPDPDGKRSQGRDVPGSKGYMRTEGHTNTTLSGDTVVDWSPAFALAPSIEVAYVWHAGIHAAAVAAGLESLGLVIRTQIVWVKTQFAMSRGDYHWQHEPCWYAVRKGATAGWLGDHDLSTVWELASPKMIMGGSTEDKFDHPAQKPVECMSRAIRHHAGDVFEPFCGSGTTIIAAEQLGRRCHAMELEPRYVQVSIERWQAFTGRQAERIGGAA